MKYSKYVCTMSFSILLDENEIIKKDIIFDSFVCLANQMRNLYELYDGCPILLDRFVRSKVYDKVEEE